MATFQEAQPFVASHPDTTGSFLLQIISPGQGSSGYYTAEVLEDAAQRNVWPKGTHMYIDHPDKNSTGSRSLKDLAGVLSEDGVWTGTSVVAKAKVFGPYRSFLEEAWSDIGVSIRADGDIEERVIGGIKQHVVTRLDSCSSVDYVDRAGRGGQILQLLESATFQEALTNDRRQQLQLAVRTTYEDPKNPDQYVWVSDFDDVKGVVYFEISGLTYKQSYSTSTNDREVVLKGSRTRVRPVMQYLPVTTVGSTNEASKETNMPNIEEARLAELEEAEKAAGQLRTEKDKLAQELEESRSQAAALLAEKKNRDLRSEFDKAITVAMQESAEALPLPVQQRIQATLSANTVPLTESGTYDGTAGAQLIKTAVEAEVAYLKAVTTAPTMGFGESTPINESGKKTAADAVSEAWGTK